MKAFQDGDQYIVRGDRGELIPDMLVQLASEQGWKSGSLTGIGGVDEVVLAYYDLEQKKYLEFPVDGRFELLSLIGNLSLLDGVPFWHLHAVVSDRNGHVHGGHLISMRVAVTLECWIRPGSKPIERQLDDCIGLNLLTK